MDSRTLSVLEICEAVLNCPDVPSLEAQLTNLSATIGFSALKALHVRRENSKTSYRFVSAHRDAGWQLQVGRSSPIFSDELIENAARQKTAFTKHDCAAGRTNNPTDDQTSASTVFVPTFDRCGLSGLIAFIGIPSDLSGVIINLLHLAGLYTSSRFAALLFEEATNPTDLTPREVECLKWSSNGLTSSEIAEKLGISRHTADWYLKEATQKLGAQNRTHAVMIAYRKGLII